MTTFFKLVGRHGSNVTSLLFATPFQAECFIRKCGWDGSDFRIVPATWRDREHALFNTGVYSLPVWCNEPFWFDNGHVHRDHFVHVSLEDPTKLAYTESEEKGEADRQTTVKPGRYLAKFFPHLTQKQLTFYSEWFVRGERPPEHVEAGLHFASTPEDIVHVYANGPSSCMHGESYVRVYGAGDLAVAYLVEDEQIIARALCWPEKKVFGRIYPETCNPKGQALFDRLKAEGYSSHQQVSGAFNGARMLKIELDYGGYVMPYLDHGCFDDDGEFWVMNTGGRYYCDSQCGEFHPDGDSRWSCDRCGGSMDEEDARTVYNGHTGNYPTGQEDWCPSCAERHAFSCDATEECYSVVLCRSVELANGELWNASYADHHAFLCAKTGDWYPNEDLVEMANGDSWSAEAFEAHGFTCGFDGLNYAVEDESTLWPGFPAELDADDTITPEDRLKFARKPPVDPLQSELELEAA